MSTTTNHFSSSSCYLQNMKSPNININININNDNYTTTQNPNDVITNNGINVQTIMFEKSLTPSDVGKLNRLVIPKQHAEKYFPLADPGLLLSFEDELGKSWRFRYSYWNSSQSYVLTKGWSRYVKDKRLDAGDVVFFARDKDDCDRFLIGWRRRCNSGGGGANAGGANGGGGGGWWSTNNVNNNNNNNNNNNGLYPYPPSGNIQGHGVTVPNQPNSCLHAGVVQNQTRTTSRGSSRTVRLFGVNLECGQLDVSESEPSTSDSVSWSSQNHHLFYSDDHQSRHMITTNNNNNNNNNNSTSSNTNWL
ncbi:hypothetical protein ACFE04_000267 [Oxalis oulophora]